MANITVNRINITISAADEGSLNMGFSQIKSVLDTYTKSLTPEERDALFGLDVENRGFAHDALGEAQANGGILPNYISAGDMDNDLKLYEQLNGLETLVDHIAQRIKDTKRLAAHEAYAMALTIYKLYESAHLAGIEDATVSYLKLKQRFEQQGGGAPKATNNPPSPAEPV